MNRCAALLFLLLSSPAQAALNCLPKDAELSVLYYNGYIEYESGDGTMGDVRLFVNATGAFKIIVIKDGMACEILEGRQWYLSKERKA